MLIIEGPDNVGKTTLCERLVKELDKRGWPAVYRHFTRLPASWDYYHDYVRHIEPTAVMDRFWMSEPVYAAVRGESTQLTRFKIDMLQAKLTLAGSLTVLINATEQVIQRGYAMREQMYTLEKAYTARQLYEGWRHVADVTYTMTTNDPYPSSSEPLVELIVESYLRRQGELANLAATKRWPNESL